MKNAGKNAAWRTRLFVTGCSLLFLISCIDVATDISVNDEGSGTIRLSYTALSALVNLGTIDEDDRFYTVPISEEDFRNTAESIEGITLRSFDLEDNVDTVTITATLDFDSPDALSSLFRSSGPGGVEIVSQGETTVYRQLLYGGAPEEIQTDSREFIEAFLSEYAIEFSLEAPRNILAVNVGEFSGRVATVELGMTEVLLSSTPIEWEVRW